MYCTEETNVDPCWGPLYVVHGGRQFRSHAVDVGVSVGYMIRCLDTTNENSHDPTWISYGPCADLAWIPYEPQMDPI